MPPKHLEFIRRVRAGESQAAAYRAISSVTSSASARSGAARFLKANPEIREAIEAETLSPRKAPLRLEWRTSAELDDNPRNWRKHPEAQTKGLEAAVREVGWAGALLYNETTGRLIDGHARKKLPAELAVDGRIPVLVGSWTEDQERVILATLDPLAAMAEADTKALAALLRGIEADDEAVAALLEQVGAGEGIDLSPPPTEDEPVNESDEILAALQAEWGTERGQVWTVGRHRLMCGDATSAEDVARLLGGTEPFLMVTDPPYGVEYDPAWRQAETGQAARTGRVAGDDRADWEAAWGVSPASVAYVWHASWFVAVVIGSLARYEFRNLIIWKKDHLPFGRGHYRWQHELCFYGVHKGSTAKWIGDRKQSTVWEAGLPEDKTEHGTQKPLELFRRPIRNHDAPEVYDPFAGTGPALICAEELGRTAYLMDIDPRYVATILDRCKTREIGPIALAG